MKTSIYEFGHTRRISVAVLAIIAVATVAATSPAQTSSQPTGTVQPSSDATLQQQMADLHAKMAKLEAAMSSRSQQTGRSTMGGGMRMGGGMQVGGMSGMGDMQGMQGMQGMQNMQDMEGIENKMDMMGQMMPGMSSMNMPPSALPGFPGASHIYHIGATGFFLDYADHIGLSADQQVGLNKIKEQALLSKSASDRQVEQAEQELATLTSSDQPDLKKIEAKVRDIAKLGTDQRIAFIKAVGEAAKLLTPDQQKMLTGFASPAPAASPSPSATMSPMQHM